MLSYFYSLELLTLQATMAHARVVELCRELADEEMSVNVSEEQ